MRLDPLQHHQLHLDATTDVAASHWPMNAWYAGAYDVEVGRRLTPVRVAGVPIVLYRRLAPSIRRRTAIRYGNLDDRGLQSPVHRAASIDYGIVLEGEITLVLDDSEVTLRAGDVAVQRGTDHAWANRGDVPAKVVFVLVDGEFDEHLAATLPRRSVRADARGPRDETDQPLGQPV